MGIIEFALYTKNMDFAIWDNFENSSKTMSV
jgi:hypothetical protein